MKSLRRDAFRIASTLAFVSAGVFSAAHAQESPKPSELEEVVVTGSLIRGATEDGPLTVEVFSAADLEAQGSPNIVEFTRSLTSSTEALGEPNIDLAGTAAGRVTVNLRGLGATRTMVLLNGHRTSDDVSFIPTNALERIEVLQDGAGVTYGAGAVGGVMNFVTKRNFRGLELTGQHKFIDGSDKGAQEAGFVWGFGTPQADVLFAIQYARQGMLNMSERDYGTQSFARNREQYVTVSAQPGVYQIPNGLAFARVPDFNSTSCNAVGGVYTPGGPFGPTAPECMYYYTPLFNFTDETENIRLFGSVDYDISDTLRGRLELGYSKTEVPETWAAPVIPPDNARRAVGNAGTLGFNFAIPYSVNGVANLYVQDFYSRNLPGVAVPTAGFMYTGYFWEPFALNGNPLYEGGARYESREADRWGFSASLEGESDFLNGVNYNFGVSGGMTRVVLTRRDLLVSRLQNAILGYGGPNCTARDEVPTNYTSLATYNATTGIQNSSTAPGTNGCEWFNPFASSFASSAVNGAANPAYGGASFQNSRELLRWIQPDMPLETRVFDVNVDVLFSGELPEAIALPGGNMSWAFGGQYRSVSDRTSSRVKDRELFGLQTQPCPWPGQQPNTTGCALDPPGAFWGTGSFVPSDNTQEVVSVFSEVRLPILDSVEAQAAVRHEDYGGGFDGTVYKIAAKWQMLDWLALRGSFSTNYAAPPPNITETTPVPGAAYITRFTTYFPTITSNMPDTGPEKATVRNVGLLLNADAFTEGSYITASVDYFDYDIKDQIVLSSVTTVLSNIVPLANGNQVTALLNCSAPLLQFTVLNGACVQGTTRLSDVNRFQVFQTNGPGTRTSGVELGLDYFQPMFGGDFSFGINATRVLKYEVEGYSINGVPFETGGDRLGFANTTRSGDFSPTLRANSYLGYRFGMHSFRVQANYTHGVRDERFWPLTAANRVLYGTVPNDYTDYDVHYRLELPWLERTDLRLSVLNVADADPMAAQTRNGYWTGVGNARGRQIEVGVTTKF